jgi:hypothetical protein
MYTTTNEIESLMRAFEDGIQTTPTGGYHETITLF